MLKKALITVAIIIAALASKGTGPVAAVEVNPQSPGQIPSGPSGVEVPVDPGEEVREEFHQTYPLSATGRVSVENLNGEVQIKVWGRAAVQVDAVKRAHNKERLAEVKIDVSSGEETIRIRTEYPDRDQSFRGGDRRNENPAVVDYTLTVPRKAMLESVELVNGALDIDGVEGNVKASSVNGRINARGLVGDTKLSTINGPLQAAFSRLQESKAIYLQSVNGSVTLIIPSDSNASVRASTVHGAISNDFGMEVRDGEYVGHNLDGQIGTGGPRIKLGNVNGGIRITHAQDGRTLSSATSRASDSDAISAETRGVLTAEIARQVEEATAGVAAAQAARIDAARVAREAQRQVDVALREAQREVERAQVEVQRETLRQVRDRVRVASGRGSGAGVGYGALVTSQETKTFTVSGTPRVEIGTFDGPITVHGWDKSEVMYNATKRAAAEDQLKNISISAQQQGSTISIIARSELQKGSAQFDVYVPRRASLHVSSGDGELNLDGVSGDITLRTGDGEIEVASAGGQLQVNTGDGRIRVANFEGQLDARTGDGSISLDGAFNALSARTGDGTISLAVPAGSNFTIETQAQNAVESEGLTMAQDVSPSQRVKRWKIGSGGKVFELHTGEGKILLRLR